MRYDTDRDVVLAIPADIQEASGESFLNELDGLISSAPRVIRIDCAPVERATSAHVGLLWTARSRCAKAKIALVLSNVSPMTRRILQVLDIDELFRYEDSPQWTVPATTGDIQIIGMRTHRQRFPITAQAARHALRRMHTFLNGAGLPPTVVLDVQTIAYELLQNVVSHSGAAPTDDIQLEVEYDPAFVHLMIAYSGIPFDPTVCGAEMNLEQAAADRRTHGFGLLLIRRLADSLRYEHRNNRNVISIDKKVG